MGIDVKGPSQLDPRQGLGKAGPADAKKAAGLSGVEAAKNAAGMAEAAFLAQGNAAQGTAAAPGEIPLMIDQLSTPEVKQELLGVFEEMKARHLKIKPDGKPSEAFSNEKLTALAQAAKPGDVEQLLGKDLKQMPREVQEALSIMADALMQKKADSLVFAQTLQGSPAHQLINSPQGKAVLAKVAGEMKALVDWVNDPVKKSKSEEKKKTGALGEATSNAEATGGAKNEVINLSDKFADAIKPIAKQAQELNMDMPIEMLVLVMMNEIAKGAEQDLREMLNKMQQVVKLKQAKRELKHELEQQNNALKDEAAKQLKDAQNAGTIDASVTLDEYLKYCNINTQEPLFNEQTGDWQVMPASLEPPKPFPENWKPVPTESETTDRTADSIRGRARKEHAAGRTGGGRLRRGTRPPLKSLPKATHEGKLLLKNLPPALRAHLTQVLSGGEQYGQVKTGNYSHFQSQIDKLDTELQSLGEQSELQGIQMQIYMDRRQKAFEMASNIFKKVSDTQAGIIKNMS